MYACAYVLVDKIDRFCWHLWNCQIFREVDAVTQNVHWEFQSWFVWNLIWHYSKTFHFSSPSVIKLNFFFCNSSNQRPQRSCWDLGNTKLDKFWGFFSLMVPWFKKHAGMLTEGAKFPKPTLTEWNSETQLFIVYLFDKKAEILTKTNT